MAFNLGDIIVTIKAKTDDLQRGLSEMQGMADKSKNLGDRMSASFDESAAASKRLLLGVTAVAAGVVAFGVSSVKAFSDSENRIAQTNAVLKSTGGIAGVTADQVTKLSASLEKMTKYDDETVRSVENLLLTFTSISKDIFPQATKTVLDMATALGEDTSSASIQLGKALQDPVLGITALRRVGVNFTEDQKNVIQSLVDTGQKAKAQQLILKELNTEFGGSAEAAGNTLAGSLAKLKNQFNNVQEAIGGILATVAVPFLTKILEWFNGIGGVDGVLKLLRQELERFKPYLPFIAGALGGMLLPALIAATIALGEFLLVLAPWAALGAGAVLLAQKLGISMDDVRDAATKVKPYLDNFLNFIKQTPQYIAVLIQSLKDLWQWFSNLTVVIIIGQFITQVLWPALQAIAAAVWQNLLPALSQLWTALIKLWNALNPALVDALKIIGVILLGAFLAAIYITAAALNILIQVFSMVVSAIAEVIGWISNAIGWLGNLLGVVRNIIAIIATIVWNIPGAFGAAVSAMIGIIRGIPGLILSGLGALGGLLYQAGKDLIGGMINGITDKFKELAGAVKNAVGNAVSGVKNFLGIKSPSRVFMEIGKNVTAGFVKGIQDSQDLAAQAMEVMGGNIVAPMTGSSSGSVSAFLGGPESFLTQTQSAPANVPAPAAPGSVTIGPNYIASESDADYLFRKFGRNIDLSKQGLTTQPGSVNVA